MIKIKPSTKSTNSHTESGMQLLEKSIDTVGVIESISVATDGTIISGHARKELFDKKGMQPKHIKLQYNEYAVIDTEIENNSKQYFQAQILANTTANKNFDLDTDLIEEIAVEYDIDFEEVGVEVEETDEVLEATEDDFDSTPPEEPITVLGDLYEIGEHRLLCGDSTCSDTVAKLMNGNKADMVFTDPPYGIDYSGGRPQVVETKNYGKLMNDNLQGVELGDLISNVFVFNKQEADVYICVSPKMQKPFLDFIENSNKKIDAVIVWDKKQPGLGYMSYRRQCEFILFIKGGAFKKGDNTDFDLWSISRDNGQDYVHGTQKPIAVPSRAINNSSKKDDLVLDYFGGSGSTMVASHQLKRKCYGMELDPKYCDVIVKRMIKLDDTLTVKRNGVDCTNEFKN